MREARAGLKKVDAGSYKLVTDDLKEAVEPVVLSGREKIARFPGARVARIRPVVTMRAVIVRQSEPKRGGKRADFGRRQTMALRDALEENQDEVVDRLERSLDRLVEASF